MLARKRCIKRERDSDVVAEREVHYQRPPLIFFIVIIMLTRALWHNKHSSWDYRWYLVFERPYKRNEAAIRRNK